MMLETLRSDKYRPKIVMLTVYMAMLVDCLLFTIVVPILPDYLIRIKESNDTSYLDASYHRQEISNFTELEHEESYHEAFVSNSIPVAMLLGSKAVVQIPVGLMVSQITYRIGYSIPLFIGFIIIIVSSLMFAFSTSYWTLLLARSLNGVGSGFSSVSGLGLLAETFPDNIARGKAIALCFGGIAIGITAGPTIGGFLYGIGGIILPFALLAGFSLIEVAIQLLLLRPKKSKARPEPTAYADLLSDPYILIAAGAIWISNLAFSMLEPSLPLWMIENWGSTSTEQGMAFLPSSLAYMIGTNMFGFVSKYFGRWQCSLVGFLMIGICGLIIPFAQNIYHLIIPNAVLGLGLGLVDTNMFPMLGHIADLRHTNVYGSVYAIGDGAACLAFATGPFMAGPIVRYFGFRTMMTVMAVANLAFAPFMLIIKRLPDKVEDKQTLPKERSVVSVIDNVPEYIKN